MSEANKALVHSTYEAINSGNLDALDALMDDSFVEHEVLPGMPTGKEGVKAMFGMLRTAFPDLQMIPQQVIAESDFVSVFATATGTHLGEFMGIPATNKFASINLADFMLVRDGKVMEHWGVMDMASLMQQLGAGAP